VHVIIYPRNPKEGLRVVIPFPCFIHLNLLKHSRFALRVKSACVILRTHARYFEFIFWGEGLTTCMLTRLPWI
jgi:hypothetical protein